MHLLATTSGVIDGAAEAIDLKQSPGDIAILSAADSELSNLARALDATGDDFPTVRLANLLLLQHNYSVDLYCEQTLAQAKLVVVRLLGGESYWSYGVASLRALAEERGIKLAIMPGGGEPDPATLALSTTAPEDAERLRQYFAHGGADNAVAALQFCASLIGHGTSAPLPVPFPAAAPYRVGNGSASGRAGIVFYRSLIEGGQTAPIDALCEALSSQGIAVSALYVASLKDKTSRALIAEAWRDEPPDAIINATAFAVGDAAQDPLAAFDCPVLQVTLAGSGEEDWRQSARGLGAKDLAMSVVLPELDGRIATRAVSFKADHLWHGRSECRIVTYKPVADRIHYVAALAANWVRLRHTPAAARKTAILLANYPNKDGRIANGVGYDTPASTIAILRAMEQAGHTLRNIPETGNALIEALQAGVTNARSDKTSDITLSLADYLSHFNSLPLAVRAALEERWGPPERDPFMRGGAYHLPLLRFGNAVVGVQPARGYNIDPKSTYHDQALVPPHGYLATYVWLRQNFGVQAIIHNGKHGNLEWLPGKATALSESCWPEIALGPVPQLYPFIVNDPGEGTQAKRRTSAVIIDHLTPPLTRAESYGPMKDLEALVDEYYLASGLDQRRLSALRENILDLTRQHRLDRDAGFTGDADGDLQRLDAYLCDLKEAQIRDGLHILGAAPTGEQETSLLVALTRVARGTGAGGDASLVRALAADMHLGFDPLACEFSAAWAGPRPDVLQALSAAPWRTQGDTVERLELLAERCVAGAARPPGDASAQVIAMVNATLRPALAASATNEIDGVLRGLAGARVAPGPSGAPTRGRLDVLPTGRNFFSIDNRTLPTPAAWSLGRRSADALLTRHFQETGQHLVSAALSAWGTSNMRTGGDDIAQALALIGAKPLWDPASWRVTGFETIPLAVLGRPRVDVTLRISGFFRDAFPAQIELLDKAIISIGALDEPETDNPIAARMRREAATLVHSGVTADEARRLAARRIFGAKPGAYGAGLQALIDEGIWQTRADLAAAFVTWGAFAYGAKADGVPSEDAFRRRLAAVEAVIHNQDNREHDLLDSDDYYQFEGGLSAAVETASGKKPATYHNDHSRPERPVVRTLDEEVARVVRSRVANPKWITGVKRHGYKGAFEIAATVDYMFAFAATADAVKSHHFDLAYEAYLVDDDTRMFLAENNPHALKDIAARLAEAISRGLWQPRLNSTYNHLKELQT
ncbi:MAG: cobaltochelatase subunit CobN [Rhizobiales bacterium]|nr:cobaltochelatase subunit CobN [Hyphomicrobiales bacterium]